MTPDLPLAEQERRMAWLAAENRTRARLTVQRDRLAAQRREALEAAARAEETAVRAIEMELSERGIDR